MPFFTPDSEPAKTAPTEREQAWSKQLYEILQAKRLVTVRPKLSKWAYVFRQIQVADKVSEDRITTILNWYAENVRKEYVPICHSAEGFRRKLSMIEEAMTRGTGPAQLPISDVAKKISKKCGLHWPNLEKLDEHHFIQQSINNYEEFRHKIKQQAATRKDRPGGWFRHLANAMPRVDHFVEFWLRDIHDMAWRWGKWHSNLRSWAFRQDHKRFEKMGTEWIGRYVGAGAAPEVWKKIIGMLNED